MNNKKITNSPVTPARQMHQQQRGGDQTTGKKNQLEINECIWSVDGIQLKSYQNHSIATRFTQNDTAPLICSNLIVK
jgi:hypothetical protein